MRLSRILLNLLGNSVKYTEKGTISVKLEENPPRIIVEDTGEGIPAEALENIFARFSKLRSSYKQQNYDGAGIGLHIAREYARDLGGDITVTSKEGKGSCFTLLLKN
jgi:two-component system aerobic respiration control sensor histidine kinase ArcB